MPHPPPETTYRIGNVFAKVWLNKTTDGKRQFRSVTIERQYQVDADNWQSTNSFPLSDLPAAVYALQRALDDVAAQEAATTPSDA